MDEKTLLRCLKCGYVLEHLPMPRCPECGMPFDPNPLGRKEPAPQRSGLPYLITAIAGAVAMLVAGLLMPDRPLMSTTRWVQLPDGAAAVLVSLLIAGWAVQWLMLLRCLAALVMVHRYRNPWLLVTTMVFAATAGPGLLLFLG